MGEAVEPADPDEEVFLEVFHHPFNLTFGSGPSWTAGPWQEAIVIGQQQEPGVDTTFPLLFFRTAAFWLSTSTVFTLPPK